MKSSFVLGGALLLATAAHADVRLPGLFTNHMVLQRNQPVQIWGWADAGESVTVSLDTAQATAAADAQGNWKAVLPARTEGTNLTLTVNGKNTLTFTDVAIGDVWLCSGQSNMAFNTANARDAAADIAAADFPNIRLLSVPGLPSQLPQTEMKGSWQPCSPGTVGRFSAVGFFFGRELHQKLNVPIGLIASYWGGTPSEAWTSKPVLDGIPEAKGYLDYWDKTAAAYPALLEKYNQETLVAWQAEADKAKAEGKPLPTKPQGPFGSPLDPHAPGCLFNGMIAPLIPYGIKGAIWYQGESNAVRAKDYAAVFPAMIKDWRTRWGTGDFPFLFVQLANFQAVQSKPVEPGNWPTIRESQSRTLSLPHTGMATAIDLADADNPRDIHPKNKQDVGKRLAAVALATVYEQNVPYSGPVFDKFTTEGDKLRIRFKFTDGGLQIRGDKLNGFAIAGDTGDWQWADATIGGDSVILSNAAVPNPTKVRYDWASNPIGNLYNGTGFPAFPFRTDKDAAQ